MLGDEKKRRRRVFLSKAATVPAEGMEATVSRILRIFGSKWISLGGILWSIIEKSGSWEQYSKMEPIVKPMETTRGLRSLIRIDPKQIPLIGIEPTGLRIFESKTQSNRYRPIHSNTKMSNFDWPLTVRHTVPIESDLLNRPTERNGMECDFFILEANRS
uniref:Uncharacterized protein n=1 Tax=Steinernema glaseri TaxID=37863 RepID=A0A1I8AKT4_9BILA